MGSVAAWTLAARRPGYERHGTHLLHDRSGKAQQPVDRMLIANKRHLCRTLQRYVRHYNGRRPHGALQLQPPRSDRPVIDLTLERIKRRQVLGGLINEYERAA